MRVAAPSAAPNSSTTPPPLSYAAAATARAPSAARHGCPAAAAPPRATAHVRQPSTPGPAVLASSPQVQPLHAAACPRPMRPLVPLAPLLAAAAAAGSPQLLQDALSTMPPGLAGASTLARTHAAGAAAATGRRGFKGNLGDPCMSCDDRSKDAECVPCGCVGTCKACLDSWLRTAGAAATCLICQGLITGSTFFNNPHKRA